VLTGVLQPEGVNDAGEPVEASGDASERTLPRAEDADKEGLGT
jgi:hypothetical protein